MPLWLLSSATALCRITYGCCVKKGVRSLKKAFERAGKVFKSHVSYSYQSAFVVHELSDV